MVVVGLTRFFLSLAILALRLCCKVGNAVLLNGGSRASSLRIAKTYIEGKRRAVRLAVIEHRLRNDD